MPWHAAETFTSTCDVGVLTTSVGALSVDQESYRRVLGRARLLAGAAPPGTRTPAETERLRLRVKGLLCGDESDVCDVLSDLNASCALPLPAPPGPPPATGLSSIAVLSDQATNIADRVMISNGSLWSNHLVNIANEGTVNADIVSGGDARIGDRTHVQGNVTAAGLIVMNPGGGATISGAQKQHAAFSSLTIPTKTVTPGATNVTVNSGQGTAASPFNFAPGSYNTVTINSNNVVALSGGVYQIGTLIVNADTTLILNQTGAAAIDLRVQTNLQLGDRLIVKPGTTPAGVVAQFYSNQGPTTEVRVGTDINPFPMALTVPNGTVRISSRTVITGSVAAKTVNFDPDVGVSRVPADAVVGSGVTTLEFLGYPTQLQYSVAYKDGFYGTVGPLALNQMPWKALIASAMIQLDLGLPGAIEAELVGTADQSVVATVKTSVLSAPTTAPSNPPSTQAGSVDAAVAAVRGNRALGPALFSYLDAAPGEVNPTPMGTAGTIKTAGTFMTNADIDNLLLNPSANGGLAVYKSGAGTGVTRGLISGLTPVVARDDESGTLYFVNQIVVVLDQNNRPAGDKIAGAGDSGALWLQVGTNKIVGMTHAIGSSGGNSTAVISRIQDVVNALQIQFARGFPRRRTDRRLERRNDQDGRDNAFNDPYGCIRRGTPAGQRSEHLRRRLRHEATGGSARGVGQSHLLRPGEDRIARRARSARNVDCPGVGRRLWDGRRADGTDRQGDGRSGGSDGPPRNACGGAADWRARDDCPRRLGRRSGRVRHGGRAVLRQHDEQRVELASVALERPRLGPGGLYGGDSTRDGIGDLRRRGVAGGRRGTFAAGSDPAPTGPYRTNRVCERRGPDVSHHGRRIGSPFGRTGRHDGSGNHTHRRRAGDHHRAGRRSGPRGPQALASGVVDLSAAVNNGGVANSVERLADGDEVAGRAAPLHECGFVHQRTDRQPLRRADPGRWGRAGPDVCSSTARVPVSSTGW